LALAVAALEVTESGSSSSGYEVNGLTFFILLPEILLLAGVLGWLVSRGYRTLVLGGFVAAAFLSVIGVSIRLLTHVEDIRSVPPGRFPSFDWSGPGLIEPRG
jgi:hypothetical protein